MTKTTDNNTATTVPTFDRAFVSSIITSDDKAEVIAKLALISDAWRTAYIDASAKAATLYAETDRLQATYERVVGILQSNPDDGYSDIAKTLDGRTLRGDVAKATK